MSQEDTIILALMDIKDKVWQMSTSLAVKERYITALDYAIEVLEELNRIGYVERKE